MSITPSAGTYKVDFSCSGSGTNTNNSYLVSIFINEQQETASERELFISGNPVTGIRVPFHSQAIITANGSQTIEARFRVTAGTFSIYERNLAIIQLSQ
jgi:hypothetical protein